MANSRRGRPNLAAAPPKPHTVAVPLAASPQVTSEDTANLDAILDTTAGLLHFGQIRFEDGQSEEVLFAYAHDGNTHNIS